MKTIKSSWTFTLVLSSMLLLSQCLVSQGDIQWTFKTNGRVYSTPIIEGNFIYFGSADSTFYALNKSTGEQVWKFKTQGAVHSSPNIFENVVYFGSADGNLYALDKSDGSLIWKLASEGEKKYGLWDYYLSSPTVKDGKVYWGCGDGHLYAADAENGKVIWRYNTGDIIHATPKVFEDKVLVGGFDGNFYAFDKNTGAVLWRFKTVGAANFPKGEIQRGALVKDGVAYFGSRDYNIYAVDVNSGRGRWNMKQPRGWIVATPIEYKGGVYFGTSDDHSFYCLDKTSGEILWRKSISMRVYGRAVALDDIVYFGTFDGKVLGVDHKNGQTLWEFQTYASRDKWHTIFKPDGHFRDDFQLYGSNYLESEARIHSLGSVLSSPVIDQGVIYFGSSEGIMYAVNLN